MDRIKTLEKMASRAELAVQYANELEKLLLEHFEETESRVIHDMYEDTQQGHDLLRKVERLIDTIKENEKVKMKIKEELKN